MIGVSAEMKLTNLLCNFTFTVTFTIINMILDFLFGVIIQYILKVK